MDGGARTMVPSRDNFSRRWCVFMETAETLDIRMREDELTARIRYHEDQLREEERLAAFHRNAMEAARAEQNALRQPAPAHPRLNAA